MENNGLRTAFIGLLLAFTAVSASADVFSKTFNPDYLMYGFSQIGFTKSPSANALTQSAYFATGGDIIVLLDETKTDEKNGKFKMKLLLRKGLTRVASLELVIQSDTVTKLNYITRLDYYDFSATPRKSVEIDWNGNEQRLDNIIKQLGLIVSRFYNTKAF